MSITIKDKIKQAHTDTIANFRLDYVCVYIKRTQLKIKDCTMFVCTIGQVQNMQTDKTENYNRLDYVCVHQDKIKYEGGHNCKLYRLDYVCVHIGQDKICRQTQLQTIKDWTMSVCTLDKIKYADRHNCKTVLYKQKTGFIGYQGTLWVHCNIS